MCFILLREETMVKFRHCRTRRVGGAKGPLPPPPPPPPPTNFLCEKIKKSSRPSLHALRFLTRLRFLRKLWSKKMYSLFFLSCIDVHNDQVIMQPLSRRRYSKGKKSFSSAHRSNPHTIPLAIFGMLGSRKRAIGFQAGSRKVDNSFFTSRNLLIVAFL